MSPSCTTTWPLSNKSLKKYDVAEGYYGWHWRYAKTPWAQTILTWRPALTGWPCCITLKNNIFIH